MACQGILGSPCKSSHGVLPGDLSSPGPRGFLSARGLFWTLGLAHPLTWVIGSQRLSRQAQVGLVWLALGFPAAKLREISVGFAKSWDEECDAQDFFCSAPPAPAQAAFVWVTSPKCPQGDEGLQSLEEGAERIARA